MVNNINILTEARERPSAADIVFARVIEDLERGRIVPGQRLLEADLCLRCGVSRGSVREALQRLASHGIVELAPYCGASVAQTTLAQACKTLELVEMLSGLMARNAAENIQQPGNRRAVEAELAELRSSARAADDHSFINARHAFYTTMLDVGDNAELRRLVSYVQVHVVDAQFQLTRLRRRFVDDYQAIGRAVLAGDPRAAEKAARSQIRRLRLIIEALGKSGNG